MRGRRNLLRLVVASALLAAIVVAAALVADYESPTNRRLREIAKAAATVPPCGPGTEIHMDGGSSARPGPRKQGSITCGDPMGLGDLVGVEIYRSSADVSLAMQKGRQTKHGVAQCATDTERFDLMFNSNDETGSHWIKDERGWDRAFCKRIGAAPPQFTGDYLLDGDNDL